MLPARILHPGHPLSFRRTLPRPRLGLGADFSSLMQVPEFSAAWNDVQAQMQAESASSLDIAAAQNDLAASFDNLTSGAAGFGLSAAEALSAAKQYVTAGRTVAGAVSIVQGLASSIASANPAQDIAAFQAFTGTLIGAATAAGALSAGVGAVIVAGLAVAIDLLQSVGLFGSPPPNPGVPYYVSPVGQTFFAPSKPAMTVGGVYSLDATPIAVGSPHWRHFPEPSEPSDAGWFSQQYGKKSILWAGAKGGTPHTWNLPAVTFRMIDAAFWDYWHVSTCPPFEPTSFAGAFYAAWKANKAYALNGLAVQPDWQVLAHAVRLWNRAHEATSYADVAPVPMPPLSSPPQLFDWKPTPFDSTLCRGIDAQGRPTVRPPFFMTVIQDLLDNTAASDPILSNGGTSIRIYEGPLKKPKKLLPLRLGPPKTSSPLSTPAGKIAVGSVGAVAAVAAGGSLYAFLTNQAIGYFWGKVFDGAVDGVRGLFK